MTAALPKYTISKRVHFVWKKLSDWYGAETISKQFGAIPPQEWCEEIDSIGTKAELDQVLVDMRAKHVTFPPRLPEFAAIVSRAKKPVHTGPSIQEQLAAYVLRTKRLTSGQVRGWTYFGGNGFPCIGVEIPADGNTPGFRVTITDMATTPYLQTSAPETNL